jgi:mono/diheme cytochrome c family protein
MKWAVVFFLLSGGVSFAADLSSPAEHGRILLQANCSRCHAIGPTDESPHEEAPPFREVMKIYGAKSLEEALGEGLVTGHPDMPEFVFAPEDVAAIEAYLMTLESAP